MGKNVLVGQSGGPTAVINCSLAGVVAASMEIGAEHVYGMCRGIKGLLEGKYIDFCDVIKSRDDIELLKRTPSSYLGSCRYKVKHFQEDTTDYIRLFELFDKLEIGYFFYIGGNDSMDTIIKLSDYGKSIGSKIRFIGVPKTIDNDLRITDHAPGYGSAAKYIATALKEVIPDATVYGTSYVTIVEIMGRDAGWLAAAASLAKGEDSDGVDLIYLPEVSFDVDDFVRKVSSLQEKKNSLVIAVSEGIKLSDGRYVCELNHDDSSIDVFGHRSLTGTSRFLAHTLNRRLKTKTRYIELSTLQRCASHMTSLTDANEAFSVGEAAVTAALSGESGKVVVIERVSDKPYKSACALADVHTIANVEKKVPLEWIDTENCQMKQQYIDYALPLIAGELVPIYENGLPKHLKL